MGDHLSPIMEGFNNPTMNSVFREMLKTTTSGSTITGNVAFLESLVKQQKDLADSLMQSAKKIGPVIQRKIDTDEAYDAAFESDLTAPLPNISGTLQGFTLFFFILSFACLALVFSININYVSGNTLYAVYTFICFIFLFILSMSLITRLG